MICEVRSRAHRLCREWVGDSQKLLSLNLFFPEQKQAKRKGSPGFPEKPCMMMIDIQFLEILNSVFGFVHRKENLDSQVDPQAVLVIGVSAAD